MDPTQVPTPPAGNGPWWAVAGGAAVGLIMGAARAYFWIRHRFNTAGVEERKNESDEREAARRAAAAEAWELNERLMSIIRGHDEKMAGLTEKYEKAAKEAAQKYESTKDSIDEERRKCERELAEMCGRLTVIEAWARKKGMPLDGGSDLVLNQDGSGSHAQAHGGS